MIIEGIFIIILMLLINLYFYHDWQIKKQIKEKCGYTTSTWECVCEKKAVDFYKAEQNGNLKEYLKEIKPNSLQIKNV